MNLETGDTALLGIGRWLEGEKLLSVFNFSDHDKVAYLHEGDGNYKDLVTGKIMTAWEIMLPAYGFCWLKKL